MDAKKMTEPASGYVKGMEDLGEILRQLAYVEAHDVRGVLNSISMAAYNSRARISRHDSSNGDAAWRQRESFEAVRSKLDRIIEATRALDARVQLLVDLVSTHPAEIVPALRVFESILPDLTDPGFIEVRIDEQRGGCHPRLSGMHILSLLVTWANHLNDNRHRLGKSVKGSRRAGRPGGVIELVAGQGGHPVLTLTPGGEPSGRSEVVVRGAFEAFAAVTGSHLPVVRIPLEG